MCAILVFLTEWSTDQFCILGQFELMVNSNTHISTDAFRGVNISMYRKWKWIVIMSALISLNKTKTSEILQIFQTVSLFRSHSACLVLAYPAVSPLEWEQISLNCHLLFISIKDYNSFAKITMPWVSSSMFSAYKIEEVSCIFGIDLCQFGPLIF